MNAAVGELSWRWMLAGLATLVLALLTGMALGPAGISPVGILGDLASRLPLLNVHNPLSRLDNAVLWELRAPRVALGALVGATLAISGGAYQAVFRNPLADPYLLGAAAGAGLGATVAIVYGEWIPLPLAAFAGAIAAAGGAYLLGRSVGGGRDAATLILAGVAIAAFLTALQTLLLQQNTENVRAVYSWLLGRLSTSGWGDVQLALPYAAVSVLVILANRRILDALRVGDDEALGLGVPVARVRLLTVGAATLGTAAAVAVSGLIGFVGIVVPHAVRLLAGSSYRVVLPLSALFGAAFLVLADVVARTALSPSELPIGVVTACVGAPFFAILLRRARTAGA
ncbi:MAG: cobalamin transport system permease protein [Solirubrobacterales bacterium]|jgi:iron complex transport system permease protein|nr:cobalamin transport system permease protein [Solirubrobacterales bacterium]